MPALLIHDEMFGILLIPLLLLIMVLARVPLPIVLDRKADVVLIDLADKLNIISVDNKIVCIISVNYVK